ncbi:TlpA disulfide reductase family protein [Sphingobacterium sp.]|uniref:TlpA family protein disulfide reductase n=1 Tax=Sphingobacterium sp. TaxID=341027 RepID=UPI0028A16D2A|nr:TlpA disulfide reductase family protein [Sphingobacterium sp.]
MSKRGICWILLLIGLLFLVPYLGQARKMILSNSARHARIEGYDVSFKDSQNKVVSLNQLIGKVVIINLWATWCSPCLAEMPSLDQLHKDFKSNSNVVILSVDIDGNLRSSSKFLAKRKFGLPVYQLNSALPKELSTKSIPTTIILDKSGKLVIKHIGGMNFGSQKFRRSLLDLTKE